MRFFLWTTCYLLKARSSMRKSLYRRYISYRICQSLGFIMNLEKSCPLPSQTFIYLGVELNSATRARSCGSKWRNCSEISTGVSKTRTALSVTQLLGIRISWSRGDPHGSPPQEETPEVGHSLQKPAVLTYWVINCIARGIPLSQICLLQSTVMTTITAYHREASPTGE